MFDREFKCPDRSRITHHQPHRAVDLALEQGLAAVRQRTAEIGVRMAFGAQPGAILGLVVKYGMRLAVVGFGVGLLASFALTRFLTSLLVDVPATDPVTYGAVAALFLGVAALASYLPALRATRVDPMVALRKE